MQLGMRIGLVPNARGGLSSECLYDYRNKLNLASVIKDFSLYKNNNDLHQQKSPSPVKLSLKNTDMKVLVLYAIKANSFCLVWTHMEHLRRISSVLVLPKKYSCIEI